MKHGFVKVAAATPTIKVADTTHNGMIIRSMMKEAAENGAKIVVFPELCITGYTCGDLFFQDKLIQNAKEELVLIAKESEDLEGIFFVGLPFESNGKLYDAAAAVSGGEVLGIVPKVNLAGYYEFSEGRYFTSGEFMDTEEMLPNGQTVLVTTNILFCCPEFSRLKIAVEICEDLWVPSAPSVCHTMAGATIVANLAASDELAGKEEYQRNLIRLQSGRLLCGYIFSSAGEGESTQDVVYSGRNYIAENGSILKESKPFENGIIYSEIDVERLEFDRRRKNTYEVEDTHICVPFHLKDMETELTRQIEKNPFVPTKSSVLQNRCENIFMIQAMGLKKRMEHTHTKSAVIGISGGLDSTLALLVIVKAFDLLKKDRKNIIAVTMPGFGTTDRTYENAVNMIQCVGASFMEISIKEAVMQHFTDIGHNSNVHDVTYENAQARERTHILMDIANRYNGMVIGTGDMSELALGWATYNGDHMSMYGVNGSVPKTLVRHLVKYYAQICNDEKLSAILLDVLDTPVSPELLPPQNGRIAQKTEDLVGPYELHDFFLYYVLRFGFTPEKIYRLAKQAFHGIYEDAYILNWLKTFYRRFFTQQYKRSCLPDGPKVGTLSVSPRGDLRMPSDASARIWLAELEDLN